jgi:hypothetical protein
MGVDLMADKENAAATSVGLSKAATGATSSPAMDFNFPLAALDPADSEPGFISLPESATTATDPSLSRCRLLFNSVVRVGLFGRDQQPSGSGSGLDNSSLHEMGFACLSFKTLFRDGTVVTFPDSDSDRTRVAVSLPSRWLSMSREEGLVAAPWKVCALFDRL